jgi:hypothetical protein
VRRNGAQRNDATKAKGFACRKRAKSKIDLYSSCHTSRLSIATSISGLRTNSLGTIDSGKFVPAATLPSDEEATPHVISDASSGAGVGEVVHAVPKMKRSSGP